jgi:hypothetical protein
LGCSLSLIPSFDFDLENNSHGMNLFVGPGCDAKRVSIGVSCSRGSERKNKIQLIYAWEVNSTYLKLKWNRPEKDVFGRVNDPKTHFGKMQGLELIPEIFLPRKRWAPRTAN